MLGFKHKNKTTILCRCEEAMRACDDMIRASYVGTCTPLEVCTYGDFNLNSVYTISFDNTICIRKRWRY